MEIFYVIRNPKNNTYVSVDGNWCDFFLFYAKFDSEEEAISEIKKLDGYFIIEKVYHL
jgi:hypothetical protein